MTSSTSSGDPTDDPTPPAVDVSDAGLRPLRKQIAALGGLSAVTAITDSLSLAGLAALLAGSIEKVQPELSGFDNLGRPWVVIALVAVTFGLSALNLALNSYYTASWEARRRVDLVRAFRSADFSTQTRHSGSSLSVAAEQIGTASTVIGSLSGLITAALRTVVYLGVAFAASPAISGVAVGVGGLLVVGLRGLTRRTRALHLRISRDRSDLGDQIGEMTSSSRELHLLNRWQQIAGNLERRIESVRHARFVSASFAAMVGPIYWSGTLVVGVILAAVVRGSNSELTDLTTSGLLLIRALGAAQSAQVQYQGYNDCRPYLDRTLDLLRTLRGAARSSGDDRAGDQPVIELADVSLTYGNDVIVEHLDLRISGTGGVALIGPSGSGKSTILQAMSGFIDPASGTITADGIPLALLPGDDLGHTIGLLPQDPRLFRATLRDNLTRPDTVVSDDELFEALDRVGLTATVAGFADGLDAEMGRGGEGLSGGEMQRLGLARLAINRPRVWLLDEPTSALDRTNSDRVAEIVTDAMREHLVVVVTHRPELLQHCDRVIFIEDGVVLDDGTLDELTSRHPFVASMTEGA